jgi:hypothetical protein
MKSRCEKVSRLPRPTARGCLIIRSHRLLLRNPRQCGKPQPCEIPVLLERARAARRTRRGSAGTFCWEECEWTLVALLEYMRRSIACQPLQPAQSVFW